MLHDALVLQIQGNVHEAADYTHPGDRIDPVEQPMVPLMDALDAVLFIICEIRGADNARMSVDCFAGAVGLLTYENSSMAEIGRNHAVSREAIRKRIEIYQLGMGVIGSVFQKRSTVGTEYSLCNKRNHKG